MSQTNGAAARSKADDTLETVTIIKPTRRWIPVDFKEVLRYQELLYFLAWRDIKARYKQSLLGAGWAIVQPLLSMIVFSIFFGRLAKILFDRSPCQNFVYAGLCASKWTPTCRRTGS